MAEIKPFKGLSYNSDKVNISDVVSPPYDVISPKSRDNYYAASPYNVIRLILNRSSQPYKEAKSELKRWIEKKVLVFDHDDSIYLYRQRYDYRGNTYSRYGFLSLVKIESPGSGILPHEKTYEGPKKDRLSLLEEVEANLSPIFAIFSDRDKELLNIFQEVEREDAKFNFGFEGVNHAFWAISKKEQIEKIISFMGPKSILIADGHHRYEVTLKYRDMKRLESKSNEQKSYDYLMSYFAPIEQDGLIVLPTHRLVKLGIPADKIISKLSNYFDIENHESLEPLLSSLAALERTGFGLAFKSGFCLLKMNTETQDKLKRENSMLSNLDVSILHNFILNSIFDYKGEVFYEKDEEETLKSLNNSKADAAFFLKAIPVKYIIDIAEQKLLMPQKSTYFYPKILTGLLFHKF